MNISGRLKKLKKRELQNIADQLNITGHSVKNKSLLIDHIIENANEQDITAVLDRDSLPVADKADKKIPWWKRHKIASLITIVGLIGSIASIYSIFNLSLMSPILNFFGWIWSGLAWIWNAILASYSIPGWILIILFLLAFVGIKKIYLAFRTFEKTDKEYKHYAEDLIHNAIWRWSWKGNNISNIFCYCPRCDAQLVYLNSFAPDYDIFPSGTYLICEHCGNQVVGTIKGGGRVFAIESVKREILRKIRTGEFKNP